MMSSTYSNVSVCKIITFGRLSFENRMFWGQIYEKAFTLNFLYLVIIKLQGIFGRKKLRSKCGFVTDGDTVNLSAFFAVLSRI